MEAIDLMIGDWVYDTILQGYTRVKMLTARGIQGDIHDNIWDEKTFEPIPLTPEILEKNGMRVFEHRNPWQGDNLIKKWYHKSGSYYVSLYKVGQNQTFTIGGVCYPSRICNVRYIHQLQHALRLCGIKKEITI